MIKRLLALLLCLSLLLPVFAFAEDDEDDIDMDDLLDMEDIDFDLDENGDLIIPEDDEEDYFDESAYSSSGTNGHFTVDQLEINSRLPEEDVVNILLIGVDLGAYYYVENRRREKRVKALLEENARHRLESQQMRASLSPREEDLILHFKADRRIISIDARKIVYVESMSEYVKFHLTDADEPIVVLYSLKNLIGQLPADKFMRIHRSYIISLSHIAEASRTSVRLDNGIALTVGELYRPAFSEYLASCRNG